MLARFTGLGAALLAFSLVSGRAAPPGFQTSADSSALATSKAAKALDLSGKPVDPFDLSAGKPLVLIFVRTDCPISNRYAPTIEALSKRYADAVLMMLVYPDRSETPAAIEKHLHEYGYEIPALRDTRRDLVRLSEVEITPEAAVFKGNRELIYHGRIDNWYKDFGHPRIAPTTHELDEAIQAALSPGRSAPASVGGVGCYISDLQ